MPEYATVSLESIAQIFSGGTPSKADPSYWKGTVPWLTPKDMAHWNGSTEEMVSVRAIGNGTRLAPEGASYVAVRGMSLHNEIRILRSDRALTFNQDIKAIVPNEGVDSKFLYYALLAKKTELLASVEPAGHGTGVLHTEKLRSLAIRDMAISEQHAIAELLSNLDDKIDLNRRMNETLEAMARAIFKDWFVDFGPTRAKAERRQPPGLSAEVAALFPDALDDEGNPKGWQSLKCGDFVRRLPVGEKYDQRTALAVGKTPILDQGKSGLIGFHNGPPGVEASLDQPVAVFANHTCYMRLLTYSFSAIQNVLPFVGKGVDTVWAYYATQGNISFNEYKGHWPDFVIQEAVVPPLGLTVAFADLVKKFICGICSNEKESTLIVQLRDLLLPKLMSGEICLKEAEHAVEAVL